MLDLSHKKLEVYQNSLELIKEIYLITQMFPEKETYGLISQLRRSAVSIIANISEGLSRTTKPDKKRFIEIARSSLVEVDTHLEIAIRLEYCSEENIENLDKYLNKIFAVLSTLIVKLK